MKKLIEKLKDKTYVRPFGLMAPEEQECLISVGKINCMWYSMHKWQDASDTSGFFDDFTYAIKPGYQPEPEFVDLEIGIYEDEEGISGERLAVSGTSDLKWLSHGYIEIHELPSLPNFERFMYHESFGKLPSVGLAQVATKIYQGHQVYARFRKKENKNHGSCNRQQK